MADKSASGRGLDESEGLVYCSPLTDTHILGKIKQPAVKMLTRLGLVA